ncbi:MAG: hypothetical protein JSS97_11615 [Actinobacteria bacterium]|nr:hypothetical protein [Actinomycetota bacterium]
MRRFLLLGAVMAAAVLVVGCGSGASTATDSQAHVAPPHNAPVERTVTETPPPPPPPEAVGGPLRNVGTITAPVAAATTFSDHFLLGPLLYSDEGTPPEAVLNACRVNSPSIIARSVFARGQVTIRYAEGSLPSPLGINFMEVVRGVNSRVALRVNGEWLCENVEGFFLEFEPGEAKTFPLWVIALTVLSNAEPRVSKEVLDTWHFDPIGVYDAEESASRVYGPGTGRCENEYENEWYMLLLYNRSGHC